MSHANVETLAKIVREMRGRLVLRSCISNAEWAAIADRIAALDASTGATMEYSAVGGFRFDQHAGWQQVADCHVINDDVVTLFAAREVSK